MLACQRMEDRRQKENIWARAKCNAREMRVIWQSSINKTYNRECWWWFSKMERSKKLCRPSQSQSVAIGKTHTQAWAAVIQWEIIRVGRNKVKTRGSKNLPSHKWRRVFKARQVRSMQRKLTKVNYTTPKNKQLWISVLLSQSPKLAFRRVPKSRYLKAKSPPVEVTQSRSRAHRIIIMQASWGTMKQKTSRKMRACFSCQTLIHASK